MGVTLDAPDAPGRMWLVRCDTEAWCYRRLYLFADDPAVAVQRAEEEFGWRREGGQVLCRDHRHG